MSSLPQLTTMTSAKVNRDQWVIHVQETLDKPENDNDDDNDDMPCISCVPKALMSTKPEAFIPQQVGLGPYHICRPELYDIDRYKLDAAKKTQKLRGLKFHNLVKQSFTKLNSKIRACYERHIDFNDETLCWIMAVDASFLLEFLRTCAMKRGMIPMKSITFSSSSSSSSSSNTRISHLMDLSERKSSHSSFLRDIMMLENQVPLFLLRKILEIQHSSLETADDFLRSLLECLCREICPFKVRELEQKIHIVLKVTEPAHLLDFLYHLLVPKPEQQSWERNDETETVKKDVGGNEHELMNDNKESFEKTENVKQRFSKVWEVLSRVNQGPIKRLVEQPKPWTIIRNCILWFSSLAELVENIIRSLSEANKEETNPENHKLSPLMEEIAIPSVTELYKAGFRFLPIDGNIETIRFDVKTSTLYLPTISLDVNTEVILRNLVAYEVSMAPGPLIFTRYTEFMNGIIDTGEDAMILREKGIIFNRLKSDEEVAKMWNGMSRSVKLTKVPLIDKVIEDLNKYYACRWKVKMKKGIKTYVYGSWKILTCLAAILMLLLMGLQAFCSVYNCANLSGIKAIPPGFIH